MWFEKLMDILDGGKNNLTLNDVAIDVDESWIVKWYRTKEASYKSSNELVYLTSCYRAFPTKDEAVKFANNIKTAHKVLGNGNRYFNEVKIEKQGYNVL